MANICRLCLSTVPPFSIIPVYKDRSLLEGHIKYLLPEIDMDLTSTFNLCNICGNLLQTTYSFVRTCRETEETIEQYITRYNSTPVNLDEVKKFKYEHLHKIREGSSEDFIKIETRDAEIKTEVVEQISGFVCNKCYKTFEDEHMVEQHQRGCFLFKCNQCEKALHTIEEYNKHCESHSILTASVLNVDFHEVDKFQVGNSTMIRDVSEDVAIGLQTLEMKTEIEEVDEINLNEKCYEHLEDETIEKESGHFSLCQKVEDVKVEPLDVEMNTEMSINVKEQLNVTFVCNECHKIFEGNEILEKLQKEHLFYKCDQCENVLITKDQYNRYRECHSIVKTQTSSISNETFHQGSKLDVHNSESPVFSSQTELQNHNLIHKTSPEQYCNLTSPIQFNHKTDRPHKCQICGMDFKRKTHLTRHIQCKHEIERPYKCETCDMSFKRESYLISHIESKHEIGRPYKCSTCNMSFKQRTILTRHIQCKHGIDRPYKCQICDMSFKRKITLTRHIQYKHEIGRPYKCQTCGMSFKQKGILTRHIQYKHEIDRPYKCQTCDMNFKQKGILTRHIQCKHEIDRPYECHSCGMSFKQKGNLTRHIQYKHEKDQSHKCQTCNMSFNEESHLTPHKCKHEIERPHKCQTCGVSFRQKGNLTRHILCKHEVERPYKCHTCSMSFTRKSHLTVHIKCKHEIHRPYKCQTCSMSFKQKRTLTIHIQCKHEVDRPHKCQSCGMSFKQKSILRRHIQCRHEIDRPYKCQICGKGFNEKTYLTSHMRSMHEIHGLYTCKICGKSFAESSLLILHTEAHVKPNEKGFQCLYEGCDKKFGMESDRANHLRRHRIGKPHKCESCGKAFADRGTLKIHMTLHTGEKPFKCHWCDKAFRWKNTLRIHLKLCRGEDQSYEMVKVEETKIMEEEVSLC